MVTEKAKEALKKFIDNGGTGQIEIGHVSHQINSFNCNYLNNKDYTNQKYLLKVNKEGGTVGAVALDCYGNLTAATSTGGKTGKYRGRVGDTPQLGSGTYADNELGAVSTTGIKIL